MCVCVFFSVFCVIFLLQVQLNRTIYRWNRKQHQAHRIVSAVRWKRNGAVHHRSSRKRPVTRAVLICIHITAIRETFKMIKVQTCNRRKCHIIRINHKMSNALIRFHIVAFSQQPAAQPLVSVHRWAHRKCQFYPTKCHRHHRSVAGIYQVPIKHYFNRRYSVYWAQGHKVLVKLIMRHRIRQHNHRRQ